MNMGMCLSCCRPSATNVLTPDPETRRRQLLEAADRRRQAEEERGVRDPEKVKRMQQRTKEMEKREIELQRDGGATLKWTAN